MKKLTNIILSAVIAISAISCNTDSGEFSLESPDSNIKVSVWLQQEEGRLVYDVSHNGQKVLETSALGLEREDADFSKNLTLSSATHPELIEDNYELYHGKQKEVEYKGNEATLNVENEDGEKMEVIFRVSNDGVAFRYYFPEESETTHKIVEEHSSFKFPVDAKGWLQPMSEAKSGWAETNPSYEEQYMKEVPVDISSPIGFGWVYPALFKSHDSWVLITEAALDRHYCGTHLNNEGSEYKVVFPQPAEVLPEGELVPNNTLPWHTPWRVITIGDLPTIVESTLGTDLAEPAIDEDFSFVKPGLVSWSWVILKDNSVNYDTQVDFIDFASEFEWPYCLVDGLWDQQIGREKIGELSEYAQSKDVNLWLWYNSAGSWNSAYQTPKGRMLTGERRKEEFDWQNEIGVKGIKVDFFGGDGQSVIAYYHDIMTDAARNGIMLNFHGATLPRGWHRTYPNLMTVEAIEGYEFITFEQETADQAPAHMAMTPFTRNVFDPMDFTPMNLYEIPGIERRTTNGYELATTVVFTSGVQHIAETPEGIATVPEYVKEFLTGFPSGAWDETRFITGYPGELAVLARRDGDKWYVGGINGEDKAKELSLELPFAGDGMTGKIIRDGDDGLRSFKQEEIEVSSNEKFTVSVKPHGGFVMVLE